jgi:hypothetical protein
MPSATPISQYTFTNVGPLTTTWTAPQPCATPTSVYLSPADIQDGNFIRSACGVSHYGSCYPGGASQIDEIISNDQYLFDGGSVPYYSPGLYCPDKYTVAGIAVKDGNGKLVSSSGLFAPTTSGTFTIGPGPETWTLTTTWHRPTNSSGVSTATITTNFAPDYNPVWNVLMEALSPSETALVCCPRYNAFLCLKKLWFSDIKTAVTTSDSKGAASPTYREVFTQLQRTVMNTLLETTASPQPM